MFTCPFILYVVTFLFIYVWTTKVKEPRHRIENSKTRPTSGTEKMQMVKKQEHMVLARARAGDIMKFFYDLKNEHVVT